MAKNLQFILSVDTASGQSSLKQITAQMAKVGTTAQTAASQASTGMTGLGTVLNQVESIVAGLGVSFGAVQIAQKIAAMTKEALGFQDAMANVDTLLDGTGHKVEEFTKQLLHMDPLLGSSRELANGLYESLSAGVDPAHALEFVATSAKLAKAELFDAGTSAKLLATIMNAYGREVTDVNHVSDVFVKTINDGILRGSELANSLGGVISTASMAQVSIEEVSAAIVVMTRAGLSADEAVTALNRAILTFVSPSEGSKKYAEEITRKTGVHLELSASVLAAKGLVGALQDVRAATAQMSQPEAIAMISDLFENVRGGKAVMALTGKQADFFTQEIKDMGTAAGNTNRAISIQNETIDKQWVAALNRAQSAVTEIALANSGPLLQALKDVNAEMAAGTGVVEDIKTGWSFLVDAARGAGAAYQWLTKQHKEYRTEFGIQLDKSTVVDFDAGNLPLVGELQKGQLKFYYDLVLAIPRAAEAMGQYTAANGDVATSMALSEANALKMYTTLRDNGEVIPRGTKTLEEWIDMLRRSIQAQNEEAAANKEWAEGHAWFLKQEALGKEFQAKLESSKKKPGDNKDAIALDMTRMTQKLALERATADQSKSISMSILAENQAANALR